MRRGYLGGSRHANDRANIKSDDVAHVPDIAYSGLNESPENTHIIAQSGIPVVDNFAWSTWKVGPSVAIVVGGMATRAVAELPGTSDREILTHLIKKLLNAIMENVVAA